MNTTAWISVNLSLISLMLAGLLIKAKAILITLQESTKAQQDIALALQALAQKSKEEKKP